MNLKANITQISYCVPLTAAQWKKLNRDEYDYFLNVVCPSLRAVGVVERTIEYNGHFGRNIFFDTTPDVKISDVLEVISKLVS